MLHITYTLHITHYINISGRVRVSGGMCCGSMVGCCIRGLHGTTLHRQAGGAVGLHKGTSIVATLSLLVFEVVVDSLLLDVFLACKLAQTCIATKTAA